MPPGLVHRVAARSSDRMHGQVKWFNDDKGYGFIAPDDRTADIFVHFSGIKGAGRKSLSENDKVEYDVGPGRDGRPQAINVSATK